jgi:hypothetical protein
MVLRVSVSGFIQPYLPSRAERPPSGWVHEMAVKREAEEDWGNRCGR